MKPHCLSMFMLLLSKNAALKLTPERDEDSAPTHSPDFGVAQTGDCTQ